MSGSQHDEIIELLGAYALDAVEPAEAELVEAHLPTCEDCQAEVDGFRAVAANLAHQPEPVPDGLWDRIADQLDPAEESAAPVLRLPGPVTPPDRRVVWLAVAAALILVAGLGATILRQSQRIDELQAVLAPSGEDVARAALAAPGSQVVELLGGDGTRIVGVVTADGQGYLFADDLPALGSDRTYQLWAVTGTNVVSAGVLGPDPGVVAFKVAGDVEQLSITDETAGGVPTSTAPAVVAGRVR